MHLVSREEPQLRLEYVKHDLDERQRIWLRSQGCLEQTVRGAFVWGASASTQH
jgi:hypothetical protein